MPTIIEWVKHLEEKIEGQKAYAAPFETRYRNEYVLPFIAAEYREVYGAKADQVLTGILEAPRTGAAGVVIDALTERLTVLGGSSEDEATAKALEAAWDDNDMDVMHREAHREALVRSRSFGAVSKSTDDRAIMTIESSEQAAVHRMQAPPYDVDAYLKIWVDEWTGARHGLLQLPGRDIPLTEDKVARLDPEEPTSGRMSRWVAGPEKPRPGPVPAVEFRHNARLLVEPTSEIEPVTTLVDELDLIDGLMVFAGHFGAVPIRYGTGLDIMRDPRDQTKPLLGPDGKPMLGFKPRADHFWFNSNPDAKFGQLTPATLDTFVTWANHATGRLRAKTRVASTYFYLDIKSHMSAELLKVDEAPMIRRVRGMGHEGSFNQAWRRFLALAAQVEGHRGRVKTRWGDPQTRMESQSVDAFQKAVTGGLGRQHAAEQFLGWSPELAKKAVAQGAVERAAEQAAKNADPIAAALLRDAGVLTDPGA
ncbi:hypothetical protein [Nocardioides campestrisoli]|uniref:hypothetical protein n=1 Tax=Nocardioides campestrisoli TaxID=2736757 RepID=UPI0015E6BA4F|nr:hypothetical protein [Nocardioides campestrisoli]